MQFYPYKYFSGANITVEIDDEPLVECAGISFVVNESNQPVYGYASNLYDAVIPGRRVIQGSFVVNFTTSSDNDVTFLLSSIKGNGNSFIRNLPLFDIKINYGLGVQNKESYILSNCFFISQGQTIQISENVILEEYSFIARDIFTEEVGTEPTIKDENKEVTPTKAKKLDYSSNIYEYKLFDPQNNNKKIVSIRLSQDDLNDIFISDDDETNFEDQPELINDELVKIFTAIDDTLDFNSTLEDLKQLIEEKEDLNESYPSVFIEGAFRFSDYINKSLIFNDWITGAHKVQDPFLDDIYNTATLTWINKKTGK